MSQLTKKEASALAECEAAIAAGGRVWYGIGRALSVIQVDSLYRELYATFDEYCKERWEISRANAYRLIAAADAYDSLRETSFDVPLPGQPTFPTEGTIRPLLALSSNDRSDAWDKAVEIASDAPRVTVTHITKALKELGLNKQEKPKPERPEKPPKPPKEKPAVQPKEIPADTEPEPPRSGQEKINHRKFEALEKSVGAVGRSVTELRKECGGMQYSEEIRKLLNQVFGVIARWRNGETE